jgi:hypothetical protein
MHAGLIAQASRATCQNHRQIARVLGLRDGQVWQIAQVLGLSHGKFVLLRKQPPPEEEPPEKIIEL